jgi:hypothetical protein
LAYDGPHTRRNSTFGTSGTPASATLVCWASDTEASQPKISGSFERSRDFMTSSPSDSHSARVMCRRISGIASRSSSSRCALSTSCRSCSAAARSGSGREVSVTAANSGSMSSCWASSRPSAAAASGTRVSRVGHSEVSSAVWWWCSRCITSAIWSSMRVACAASRGARATAASRPNSDRKPRWAIRKAARSGSVCVGPVLVGPVLVGPGYVGRVGAGCVVSVMAAASDRWLASRLRAA